MTGPDEAAKLEELLLAIEALRALQERMLRLVEQIALGLGVRLDER